MIREVKNDRGGFAARVGQFSSESPMTGTICTLAPFDESYLPMVRQHLNDPEVTRYLSRADRNTMEGVVSWLQCKSAGTDHVFAILRRFTLHDESHFEFVGITALHIVDEGRAALSGTIIGVKKVWGQGIGYEAKVLQHGYAFKVLALEWIYALIVEENQRTQRLLTRLGYDRLATRPECIPTSNATFAQVVYGLSRDRWVHLQAGKQAIFP